MIDKHHNFKQSIFWKKLLLKKDLIKKIDISRLFLEDLDRFKKLSIQENNLNIVYDFSKQHLDLSIINDLISMAKHLELSDKIQDLFNGKSINLTENKPALHTHLRNPKASINIQETLTKIELFIKNLYNTEFTEILCIGIGGSCLGPMFVSNALFKYTNPLAKKINLHFLANYDQSSINLILSKLNPQKTLVIISSKSFTTIETINNANSVIAWLKQSSDINNNYLNQIIAVTANVDRAINFGILPNNIFDFSDCVGGRYSIWSPVALPVIIKIGFDNFKKFLKGAYLVDEHFKKKNFIDNIPIIMGLISVWNINFMQYKSLAVIPYLDALNNFPEYLQQLSMESNGKSVDLQNQELDYDTVEIIWGGAGCNVQHSFMQMLHQGTQIVPVDFIVSAIDQEFLFANCIAQSQALIEGSSNLDLFKQCRGNRPNSILLFPELTPEILGSLIALYEHKVFVQSVMWNINPFDQWGVELGKNLANQILHQMKNNSAKKDQLPKISPCIAGLMEAYRGNIFKI